MTTEESSISGTPVIVPFYSQVLFCNKVSGRCLLWYGYFIAKGSYRLLVILVSALCFSQTFLACLWQSSGNSPEHLYRFVKRFSFNFVDTLCIMGNLRWKNICSLHRPTSLPKTLHFPVPWFLWCVCINGISAIPLRSVSENVNNMYPSSNYQLIFVSLGRITAEPGIIAVVSSYKARNRNWSSTTLLFPSQVTEFPL